ncbi:hypothetical protein U1Q18_047259 [Sarracenia purpurea var. burkii]
MHRYLIYADSTPAATILQQALSKGAPDFPLALKASAVIYKAMALDAFQEKEFNAIVPVWKSVINTLTHPKGMETFKLAMRKIKEIISDDNAQQTLINIFATLYTCLTYDVGEKGVLFPYKELRKVIFGNAKKVFPMMEERLWKMAHDPSTSEKLSVIVNSGEDTFEEVEVEVFTDQADRSGSAYQKSSRDVDGFADGDSLGFMGTGDGQFNNMVEESSADTSYP